MSALSQNPNASAARNASATNSGSRTICGAGVTP